MDLDENAKVASLLSAAGPAPVAPVQTAVAYDITPGTVEREMAQWFDAVGYPVGKTAVPSAAFGFIFERLPAAAERVAQRLRLSIDWHRAALRETDALFRFVATWPASPGVDRQPDVGVVRLPTNGWQGLRQLAEDEGYQERLISEMLDIRRHLAAVRGATERAAAVQDRDRRAGHPLFIHVASAHESVLPLIMTHGWPGSVVELLETIGPLIDPTAHGGRAEDPESLAAVLRTGAATVMVVGSAGIDTGGRSSTEPGRCTMTAI